MIDRRALWALPLLFAVVAAGSYALLEREPGARAARPGRAPAPLAGPAPPARSGSPLRFILAGGGPSPELNQVQLEQDVALARRVFTPLGEGLVLFAGGPGSRAVQVLDPDARLDPLRSELSALLAPRGGRDSSYRATILAPEGAASAEAILAAVSGALTDGDAPLTIYLAGHGDGGDAPAGSVFLTWGPGDLSVGDLATVLDDAPDHRPARFVVTACYAGGFAELAFRGADAERGAADTDRCGLFATLWDRAAAGCDPNPDRGAQEGYGIHFLHALRGEDRDGAALPLEELDLDGDGAISLLEAHTRARVASGSLDVPVTTSERFLRAVALERRTRGPSPPLPEERATIEGLRARLGLRRPEDAEPRLARVTEEIARLSSDLDERDAEIDEVEEQLAAALLHRWPVLDDPWHPRFGAVLDREAEAIRAFLAESHEAARRDELVGMRDEIAGRHDALLVDAAPLERLVRALETVELASALAAQGGSSWLRYQALLACERGHP